MTISFSNSNPSINLVGGDFDNNTSDTISFSSGTSLAANESFTISWVDGSFTTEAFSVTVIPEPNAYALIAGMLGLTWVMLRRRGA